MRLNDAESEAISSAFTNGAEYAGRARTNSQFVGDLYNAFLRRGGDIGGAQFWTNLQANYDLAIARQEFGATIEHEVEVA